MDYLPVFLDVRGRTALVVGGGKVALRKAELLVQAGALLRVVAPRILPALAALAERHGGRCESAPFAPHHLDGAALAIVATGDPGVDAAVQREAAARDVPLNVADRPALCSFILPAVVDRSPVIVAFSTGGRVPVLARSLRARLEAMLPAGLGRLAEFLGARRGWLRERLPDPVRRLRAWERLLEGPVAERVLAGDEAEAGRLLEEEVAALDAPPRGEVFLVGAGPGDPELLSLRALRLMQQADVVFYDRLVSPPVLALVRREAERIYVGKRRGDHAVPQPDINALLAGHAVSRFCSTVLLATMDYVREDLLAKAKPLATRLSGGEMLVALLFVLVPLAFLARARGAGGHRPDLGGFRARPAVGRPASRL